MDLDRLKHSYSVALKMIEIGIEKGLDDKELKDLFVLGLNDGVLPAKFNDDGILKDSDREKLEKNNVFLADSIETNKEHNTTGGELLKNNGYKYWKEVYYHGSDQDEYNSLYLDILNEADMSVDKYGNDVGFESRLEDIGKRYGIDSKVYNRCFNIIKELEKRK